MEIFISGPEVAHITSAHISLALFSREVEKLSLGAQEEEVMSLVVHMHVNTQT